MLQDKHKDLDAQKRKALLDRMLRDVSRENPDLYYQSTSDIAQLLKQHIDRTARLPPEERDLIAHLSPRDIAVLLSLH